MPDHFVSHEDDFLGVPRHSFDIDPAESEALPFVTRSIWVGNGGTMVVRHVGDTEDRTMLNVPSGVEFLGCFTHVRATSTASDLVGRY
ncbi:spike base protein, RCAP_Rcc01079 family [Amaricoccus solimangrovi]|uniref:Uncharacterized protein n=1 Tax=Amaricoccus solimangrovi TaxID=2589815 RepID=A0A501WGP8_9RHOB|nr:hypothetical protein [Amaricoccus solimangrovi]TPE47234.1 hypothetical protein FJM51_20485 [Amaricoccus solimangrovi]